MQAIEGEPLDSLAQWFRYVYGDGVCFDPSYETSIERYSNPEWDEWGTTTGSEYTGTRMSYFIQNVKFRRSFSQDVNGTSCNARKSHHFC